MKLSHPMLIGLSGLLWFAVGIYLLPLGIHFLLNGPMISAGPFYIFNALKYFGLNQENAALVLISIGLAIGYIKSKAIFAKTVKKGVAHIRSLPEKAPFYAVYTPKYLVLLGVMILLGLSMKWFSVPLDIRGFIDVAIGAALINGSVLYFKELVPVKA